MTYEDVISMVSSTMGGVPTGRSLKGKYLSEPENLWVVSVTDENGADLTTGNVYYVNSATRKIAITSASLPASLQIAYVQARLH